MRAEHLQEWLRDHISVEAATEVVTETVSNTSGS